MAMAGLSNENALWMGDIEPFMDEQYILNAYKAMGEDAVRVKFVKDKKTGGRAFFCFVIFRDKAQASRVLQVLNGKSLPQNAAKRFKLNFAQYGRDSYASPEFSLYVGELTPDVTDIMLLGFFAKKYQAVKEAKVVTDSHGKSRGYGFVRFHNEHEQSMAQAQMNGAKGLGGKPIRVSKATPKIARQIDRAFQNASNTIAVKTTSNPAFNRPNPPVTYTSDFDYPGFYSHWNRYNHCYYSQTTAPLNGAGDASKLTDDDMLEDPTLTIDVDRMNMEYIDQSEEFYLAVEDSRWFAIDSITTTYDDVCKA
ncbi:tRNA selenocysteine 1-associated protein 1-like isoform X2 [Amphiura filiformis]|uniref:tRNA selenocysteine 1-associated protein 1-like isoform X2 n=1 Tax=Amphiura filiformis TaxID=82378 RepID=UPI003B215654